MSESERELSRFLDPHGLVPEEEAGEEGLEKEEGSGDEEEVKEGRKGWSPWR